MFHRSFDRLFSFGLFSFGFILVYLVHNPAPCAAATHGRDSKTARSQESSAKFSLKLSNNIIYAPLERDVTLHGVVLEFLTSRRYEAATAASAGAAANRGGASWAVRFCK